MRSSVFTLFPPVVRGTLVLSGWSRHCRITAGLASMDVPLQVSLLSLSARGAVRGSTAPVGWSGVSPYFACCPSSSVPNRSSFGTSASGFRFESFQISIETKTCLAHLPLWLVSGLRDGVTHFGSSGSFMRPRSERRLPPFISP